MMKPYMISSIDTASGATNLYKGESEVITQVEKEYAIKMKNIRVLTYIMFYHS